MLNIYIYIMLQILVILLLAVILLECISYAPFKIKLLSTAAIILLMIRSIGLIILFLSKNLIYLYLLKSIIYICIPVTLVIAGIGFYIFLRNDKIRFVDFMISSTVVLIMYFILISKNEAVVQLSQYGYKIVLNNFKLLDEQYIFLNTISLLLAFFVLGRNRVNNSGIYLIIVASIISITECLLPLVGVRVFPNYLISELSWLVVFYFSIMKLKNN